MALILGIDPGSRITGYGLVRVNSTVSAPNNKQPPKFEYVASGCIRIKATCLSQKLAQIYAGISELIAQYQPSCAAVERVFMAKNADSALKLGQARGSALVCLANHGLSVQDYSPKEIKLAVTGTGAASKAQVQFLVQSIFKLNAMPPEDAADALAAALCHAYHANSLLEQHLLKQLAQNASTATSTSTATNAYIATNKRLPKSWRDFNPASF